MLIQCNNCSAKFNLPEKLVQHGVELRCSLCQHTFPIEEGMCSRTGERFLETEQYAIIEKTIENVLIAEQNKKDDTILPVAPKPKKPSSFFIVFLVLIFLGIVGFVTYKVLTKPSEELKKNSTTENTMEQQIKDLTIANLRQYYISNNKQTKPFFVIEGKVQNNFTIPKSFIVLKASILNAKGEVIIEEEQLAGVSLSLFQLQTMTQEELKATLTDPLEIAVTNANVPPQEEVPFMFLFFDPPKDVAEFSVQIISASVPEAKETTKKTP